jgi:hypothetical protein
MDRLSVDIRDNKTAFAPGETLEGTIQWNLESPPRRLKLSLFWYTSGKGTRDVGVAQSLNIDDPGAFGTREFDFALPDGPYSFSGKLISLIWAVELTCSPGSDTVRKEITLSPSGQEITLGEVPTQERLPFGGGRRNPLEGLLGNRR